MSIGIGKGPDDRIGFLTEQRQDADDDRQHRQAKHQQDRHFLPGRQVEQLPAYADYKAIPLHTFGNIFTRQLMVSAERHDKQHTDRDMTRKPAEGWRQRRINSP